MFMCVVFFFFKKNDLDQQFLIKMINIHFSWLFLIYCYILNNAILDWS